MHAPYVLFDQSTYDAEWSARIYLRHAHDAATREWSRRRASASLPRFSLARESFDVLEFESDDVGPVTSDRAPFMRPDVFGQLYLDLSPRRRMLGELLIHLAALFILSSAVRYSPDQWKRLLDEHQSDAILIERYLDIASRKAPNLVLNELERALFEFRFAR